MTKIEVKICGITNSDDAAHAARLGADALGFIFAESPRRIAAEKARKIIAKMPPFIKSVGVFVNEDQAAIRETVSYCGLDLVQLHGDESPDFCHSFMPRVIKAVRIKPGLSSSSIQAYQGKVRAILLDTYVKGVAGGTGRTFDWRMVSAFQSCGMPVILSGGLNPLNIVEAVRIVDPYAVDVNSGIEERPGKKSPAMMKALMEQIGWKESTHA